MTSFKKSCGILGFGSKEATTEDLNAWCDAQSALSKRYDDLSKKHETLARENKQLAEKNTELSKEFKLFTNQALLFFAEDPELNKRKDDPYSFVCEKINDTCIHPYCQKDSEGNCKTRDEYVFTKKERDEFVKQTMISSSMCDFPVETCSRFPLMCHVVDGKCSLNWPE